MLIREINCNKEKPIGLALKAIFGINKATAQNLCAQIGVAEHVKLKRLRLARVEKLKKLCREKIPTREMLLRETRENIKSLIDSKHYKGVRHMFGLPVRGQRTRTNARTSKKRNLASFA